MIYRAGDPYFNLTLFTIHWLNKFDTREHIGWSQGSEATTCTAIDRNNTETMQTLSLIINTIVITIYIFLMLSHFHHHHHHHRFRHLDLPCRNFLHHHYHDHHPRHRKTINEESHLFAKPELAFRSDSVWPCKCRNVVIVLPIWHKSDFCQKAIDIPLQT